MSRKDRWLERRRPSQVKCTNFAPMSQDQNRRGNHRHAEVNARRGLSNSDEDAFDETEEDNENIPGGARADAAPKKSRKQEMLEWKENKG